MYILIVLESKNITYRDYRMTKKLCIVFFFLVSVFFACTPYDSSATNKKLLQGNWVLYDYDVCDKDSLAQSYVRDTTIVFFDGDSLFDYNVRKKVIFSYSFKVNNYELLIYYNDSLISERNILELSEDSLVVGNQNIKFRYRKFEADYQKILKNLN